MNKFVLLFLFIFSLTNMTNAQWYLRSCGVSDLNEITQDEEFECLWKKSTNKIAIGSVTTVIGTSFIVGTIIFASNFDPGPESELMVPGIAIGALGLSIGFVLDLIGIPILITGVNRTSQLRKTPYYNNLNLGSLNIYPTINKNQFNDTYHYGLSLSFTF